jgi:RNA polymerase sigma-70 factor, ECF subfamily
MSSPPEPDKVPDFGIWFEQAGREILRKAYFTTRDPKLAEDIAQEATLKLYKAWGNEEARHKILTQPGYVTTTIRNCYLDHIKVPSRTSQGEAELDVERHDRPGSEADPDLRLAVLNLDSEERDMIIIRYYRDLTIKEAGTQLGLTQTQAYRLHNKALAHLAGLLDEGKA